MAVYGKVDHGKSRQRWTTMDNNGQQWTNTNKYPGCFMHLRCSFFLSWFFFGMFPKKREEEESMTLCAPICSSSHRKTPFPPSPQIPIGNTEATLIVIHSSKTFQTPFCGKRSSFHCQLANKNILCNRQDMYFKDKKLNIYRNT